MNDNVYVFEFDVLKFGTCEKLKTYHCLARSLFEASHIVIDFVYGDESEFHEPVEIGVLRRLTGINYIINPEYIFSLADESDNEYSGDTPLIVATDLEDEQTISFDCECHEHLRIPVEMNFPFLTCPNCGNNIKRAEIKNFGGIWIYEKEIKNRGDGL